MRTVSSARGVPGTVQHVEERWYDTGSWPSWVDGLDHIVQRTPQWPRVGGSVVWQSGPAGRGRVTEQVSAYEPLRGQTVEVEDDSIEGEQSVAFTPAGGSVAVELTLRYRLKRRSIVTPLVDLLFIRRAMAMSLDTTLARFASELGR